MTSRFFQVPLLLTLVSLLVANANVRADDEKGEKKTGKITVSVTEAGSEAEADANGEKKTVEVRTIVIGDPSKDIEKALKEAGIDEEKLQKIRVVIEKAVKGTKVDGTVVAPGKAHIEILKAIPEVIVVGPGQKEHKIELKVLADGLPHIITEKGAGPISLHKLEEALEEIGKLKEIDEKKIGEIRSAVEKAMQGIHHSHPHMLHLEKLALGDENRFFIGVECVPVEDELRSELGLDDESGLMVHAIFDDSPAEKAGIKKGDVLIQVSGKSLESHEGLIKAIQIAGKDDKKVTLTIVRGGEKKKVRVEPVQRKILNLTMPKLDVTGDHKGRMILRIEGDEDGKKQAKTMTYSIGPGVITTSPKATDDIKKLQKQVETLSKQVKQLQEALKKAKSSDKSDQ